MFRRTVLMVLVLGSATLVAADDQPRVLFTFDKPDAARQWKTVNDDVMGGRSAGRFKINDDHKMEFFGRLSLENNGGFASVRSQATKLGMRKGDTVLTRVRGDGRKYTLNLYTPGRQTAFSYRAEFQTTKDKWVEVSLPLDSFVATSFGRVVRNQTLDPAQVNGLGILLGDKQAGPFKLEVDWIKVGSTPWDAPFGEIVCAGTYPQHLQGVCVDHEAIYWSFTTQLVKTDLHGKLLKKVAVANHHGDLCLHDGKLYVAVNLGRFNDPKGNADSWVYVYDANSLLELTKHETQQVFHGAGGIAYRDGRFFVVGGLPDGVPENYVYEYDEDFRFVKKNVIKSGHTLLGIQTAAFAHGKWWFGCYGEPKILLVTDAEFKQPRRYEFDCSLGIVGLPYGRLLSATGRCDKANGCSGKVRPVEPDNDAGLRFLSVK